MKSENPHIALAALAATSAFAQSSVTIYGQVDAGVYSLSDIGASKKGATVYADGATFSNILGFKGTEDMGGGLKAGFDFQTDVQTNNGGLNNAGLFRRQANGSIENAQLGQIKLGLTTNPIIATNGLLMPTGANGNSVSTTTSGSIGYSDFYTKNAVTYTTPSIMGLVGQVQRGMANNLDSSSKGTVSAWSLNYTNGPLALRAAHQDRKQGGALSSSNQSAVTGSTGNDSEFNNQALNKKGTIMGASYAIGPVAFGAATMKTDNAAALDGARTKRKGNQFGAAYTTGAWTLGATLTKAESSKMTNLQARYALSKRTNVIAAYGIADNAANGLVKFTPFSFNTGTQPSQLITGYAGATGVKSTGMGVSLTHSF